MHKKKKTERAKNSLQIMLKNCARTTKLFARKKKNIKKLEKLVANLGQKEMANTIAILW